MNTETAAVEVPVSTNELVAKILEARPKNLPAGSVEMRAEVAKALSAYMTEKALSAPEMADKIGTSVTTVKRILNGGSTVYQTAPTQQDAAIAAFFRISNVAPPENWTQYCQSRPIHSLRSERPIAMTLNLPPTTPAVAPPKDFLQPLSKVITDHFALYGAWGGQLIKGAPIEALHYYERHIVEHMNDPGYSRFHLDDKVRLANIRAEKVSRMNMDIPRAAEATPKAEIIASKTLPVGTPAGTPVMGTAGSRLTEALDRIKALVKDGLMTEQEVRAAVERQVAQYMRL